MMWIRPIKNKQSGDPYTFLGLAHSKPSDHGPELALYANKYGSIYYREIPDFVRAFEEADGAPIRLHGPR